MNAALARFLIIEDEPLVAKALVRGVVRRGLGECVVAPTAEEAKRHLKAGSVFTALVIDINLPDGSGLDVLADARAGAYGLTPALALSGSNDRSYINRALELGAKYMVKPVEMDRFAIFLEGTLSPARPVAIAVRARNLSGTLAEIVERSALGETREAIAKARGTSVKTVENQAAKAAAQAGERSFHALVQGILREVARTR